MKNIFITIVLLSLISIANCQEWQPAGDKIKTIWAEEIDP